MKYMADFQDVMALTRRNAATIADAEIQKGLVEYCADTETYDPIEDRCTLRAMRKFLIDFIGSGCLQKTYLFDGGEQVGVPSQMYYSYSYEYCFATIMLSSDGTLKYYFTWTLGNESSGVEINLVDVALKFGLSGKSHVSNEVFAGSPEAEF